MVRRNVCLLFLVLLSLSLATSFNMDRVSKNDLSAAMAHNGTHIADIREKVGIKGLSALEDHAWHATFK